ncbi:MAG: zinc ribbon domain-containing protein [Anaerolineales bacterium]|nr:zinc ribbon domain-containing protein [Anaerolineales bacterium]
MATSRQSKGFVELEWICPNCNSRNPGPKKTCQNCGAPQPENVEFHLPADAKLIQDANVAKIAGAGPDIHCGFCGARNPSTAATCSQCGGDLKEGKARQAGRELKPEASVAEVKCGNCGEMNPSTRTMCVKCGAPLPRAGVGAEAQANAGAGAPASTSAAKRKFPWIAVAGVVACLAVVCVGMYMLFAPSKSLQASVSDVYWQTSVPVQEIQAVRYTDETGSPPSGAYNVSCRTETQQICEDKTIDKGTGYAEVVTECHDESQDYCSYTVDEWKTIQTYTLDGHDFQPMYASPSVSGNQRLGQQTAAYTVYFTADGETYTYKPDNLTEFERFSIGSAWTLRLNALGGVVSVE